MEKHFFYHIKWVDPVTKKPLTPHILLEDNSGRPLYGALVSKDNRYGYPIIDGIVMATKELAQKEEEWLQKMQLEVPPGVESFQTTDTVDSFGFQWVWDSQPRTEEDLDWRVASRYNLEKSFYHNKTVLDAGCGAGDQSKWLLDNKVANLVSIDLSDAINVANKKFKKLKNWVGIRGDLTNLPIDDFTFDLVYCEGVIQHTQDSQKSVSELTRVLKYEGEICATHYGNENEFTFSFKRMIKLFLNATIFYKRRERLSKWNRDKLFLYTGILAWMAHLPLIGVIVRKSGLAVYNPRMMNFKSTWCCTYDCFGTHAFQREITGQQFKSLFTGIKDYKMQFISENGNVLHLSKQLV